MSRRGSSSAGSGENAAMDMMSALIGCLILILIGILLIVMVAQSLIVITQPKSDKVEATILSNIDSSILRKSHAFPHGNKEKEPTYFDVHRNKIVVYPGEFEVDARELGVRGNKIERKLKAISAIKEKDYIILLIRPEGASLARKLKEMITEKYHIDVGSELFESTININFAESETRKLRDAEEAEQAVGTNESPSAPAAPSSPEVEGVEALPQEGL